MPLPFILGGLAVAAGVVGVSKAIDASDRNDRAKSLNRRAGSLFEAKKDEAERVKKSTELSLNTLGQHKINVLTGTISGFVNIFDRIHHIELQDIKEIKELSSLKNDQEEIKELRMQAEMATKIGSGIASGAVAGGLAAFGAYTAVGFLGTASTGAAISGLAGVAASNATLAALGGGALAAGGLGVAGGMAVLGGIVAGPALAIFGSSLESKSRENLANAKQNMAQAEVLVSQLDTAIESWNGITRCAQMLDNVVIKLDTILKDWNEKLESLIRDYGTDFRKYSSENKKIVAMAFAAAKATKASMNVPILAQDGSLELAAESRIRELESHL